MNSSAPLDDRACRRWLVLGAAGQLGAALSAASGGRPDQVIGLAHAELDISDRHAVARAVTRLRPDVVLNAAAYTAVDRAESESARAFAINADGAANIAEACADLDIPLIQVSTDYVFDGLKAGPYTETDSPAPLSVYGLSKLRGEQLVKDRHERSAIIRTSRLFGRSGRNFIRTIVRMARERDELRIVADQYGCPTPAGDLSDAIFGVGRLMLAERAMSGLFHFAGAEPISWHGLAEATVQCMAPLLARRPRVVAIATADYPTPARRPANSVLDCNRLAQRGIVQKSWRPALNALVDDLCKIDDRRSTATQAA